MRTILIVDTQVALLEMLTTTLQGQYRVITATNLDEAVHLGQLFKPDIVIADFILPGVRGLELVARFMETENLTKIILLSAGLNEDIIRRARALGVSACMAKPFDMHVLQKKIFQVLMDQDRQMRRDDPDKIK